ncbi:MAG: sulfatase [Planctomycetota bacterium]|nr:sulfatase [Planctomycetota bacterium]
MLPAQPLAALLLLAFTPLGAPVPSGPSAKSTHAGEPRPNVLLLSVDDLRPELGCYGETQALTPNIDRLATGGTLFRRAYCNVPVCGPSRVSVLTGLRTRHDQWRSSDLTEPFVSLPASFRAAGYTTLANGKVLHHLDDLAGDWSAPPWRSREIYHGDEDWASYNAYGQWQSASSSAHVNPGSGRGPYCEAADVDDDAYQDGQVAARTVTDLRRLAESGEPFFLAAGFWRPHLPFNAPKQYWDLYERDAIQLAEPRTRPGGLPAQLKTSGEIDRYALTGVRKETDEFHAEARHAYLASVSYIDACVGRVLDELEALDLADNTIVVLWSDHGWNLGEAGFWGKHNTRERSLRVPLVVRAPGVGASATPNDAPSAAAGAGQAATVPVATGASTTALVELVDLYPTLCELAGVPLPEHLAGTSLVPVLRDPSARLHDAVFSTWVGCRAVRTERHLYTEWRRGDEVVARTLFDHALDPKELINLAGDPRSALLLAELAALLD